MTTRPEADEKEGLVDEAVRIFNQPDPDVSYGYLGQGWWEVLRLRFRGGGSEEGKGTG